MVGPTLAISTCFNAPAAADGRVSSFVLVMGGEAGAATYVFTYGEFSSPPSGFKEVSSSRSVVLNVKGVVGLAAPLTNLLKQIHY